MPGPCDEPACLLIDQLIGRYAILNTIVQAPRKHTKKQKSFSLINNHHVDGLIDQSS